MKRTVTFLSGIAILVGLVMAMTPAPVSAQVITVEMKPPFDPDGPFPIGWAVINVPRGEVTMMAILPKNTAVPDPDDPDNTLGRWVFEGWLADLAPPHPCPVPIDDVTEIENPEVRPLELGDVRIAGSTIDGATIEPVPICGSRLSSETGFRGFPGLINRTFQYTYFPVSQGILKRLGPPLGDWQFYVGRHKTNMGLRPFDVVGVTVEPPGTGSPRKDYDPRPHPVVVLFGEIPHPTAPDGDGGPGGPGPDEGHGGPGNGDGGQDGPGGLGNDGTPGGQPGQENPRRRPIRTLRIR